MSKFRWTVPRPGQETILIQPTVRDTTTVCLKTVNGIDSLLLARPVLSIPFRLGNVLSPPVVQMRPNLQLASWTPPCPSAGSWFAEYGMPMRLTA